MLGFICRKVPVVVPLLKKRTTTVFHPSLATRVSFASAKRPQLRTSNRGVSFHHSRPVKNRFMKVI